MGSQSLVWGTTSVVLGCVLAFKWFHSRLALCIIVQRKKKYARCPSEGVTLVTSASCPDLAGVSSQTRMISAHHMEDGEPHPKIPEHRLNTCAREAHLFMSQQLHLHIHETWPSDINIPAHHTHTLKRKRAAVWGVGCLGTKSRSCENRQQVMSEQQWTLGSKGHFEVCWVLWQLWERASDPKPSTVCVCVPETKWQYKEWSELNLSREKETERKYFHVHSLHWGSTVWPPDGSQELQVQSYNPFSLSPSLPSFQQVKHSGGQQGHGARCATPAYRLRIKECGLGVCVLYYKHVQVCANSFLSVATRCSISKHCK